MASKKDARMRKPDRDKPPLTQFARYIRQRRMELGITQKELALRITPPGKDKPHDTTYISSLENARRSPNHRDDMLKRLASALEVPYFQFLEETGRAENARVMPGVDEELERVMSQLKEALHQMDRSSQELVLEHAQMMARRGKKEQGRPGPSSVTL